MSNTTPTVRFSNVARCKTTRYNELRSLLYDYEDFDL